MHDDTDDVILIDPDRPLRLSPDAMRALTKATGRTMTELLNDEDDEANRVFLKALLQMDAHEVHTARDGRDALTWLHAQRRLPHCIVLDLDMPKLDGLGVAREVQRRQLPVEMIILTMHAQEDLLRAALDL